MPTTLLQLRTDPFLFACLEADLARTKQGGGFHSHMRYPPMLEGTFCAPQDTSPQGLARVATTLTQSLVDSSLQIQRKEPITLDSISFFSLGFCTLLGDFRSLWLTCFGTPLPRYAPAAGDTPVLALAAQKWRDTQSPSAYFPFPLDEGGDREEELRRFGKQTWDVLEQGLGPLGPYRDAFLLYARWRYRPLPALPQTLDWRVRPPVGDAYLRAFRLFPDKRKPRSDSPRPPRDDADLDRALGAVREGLAAMEGDGGLRELTLLPAPHGIRRAQHELAKELGLGSESRGEGPGRSVHLLRQGT